MRVAARDELTVDDVVDDDRHAVRAAAAGRDADGAVGDRLDLGALAGHEVGALVHAADRMPKPYVIGTPTANGHWMAAFGSLMKKFE